MNIPDKIKRNTILLTLIVLALLLGVGYLFLEYQFKNSIDSQFSKIAKSTENIFNINMRHNRKVLNLKLNEIMKADGLSKAIEDKNYEEIKSIVAPYYQRLKSTEDTVNILTFRSPEGITLFRAHKPEYYGDELSEKRKLIVDTNALQRSFYGFEVGKFEMTYRITKPIFYNDKYVGNVELGISPAHFLEDLNSIFQTEMGIAIEKSLLDIMVDKNRLVVPIDDNFVLLSGSEKLKKCFSMKSSQRSQLYKIDMNIPLQNHLSETLGYLVIGFDISEILKQDTKFMYRLFFMIATMMLLLIAAQHLGFDKMLRYFVKQVYTDHLTGLQNRYALNSAFYSKQSYVLILSNIKEFSLLNEFYGVDVGNEILVKVGENFKNFAIENECVAYRISSDEFVLLKQENDFEDEKYIKLIEKLQSKINSMNILIDGVDEAINIEIYSGMAFDYARALEDAQMALKKAKKQSLPYLMYSQHVDTKEHSRAVIKVKRMIKYALEHKNIIPFFQPITDKDGKIIKYEALVRIVEFDNGEKNVLNPFEFLDISMRSGLYIKIAKDMLEQSLAFFAKREEKISVNFLPNDFFNPAIMDAFMNCIKDFDLPQRIVVEITEQKGVEDFQRLLSIVKKLRKIGVLIAIDDFGSGYANYAHILKIKPDYLKIDGSLIQNILTDSDSKILVQSIVRFAQELNITTVAEYVENEEIFELLKEYGVDEFQGYYFGYPVDLINKQN